MSNQDQKTEQEQPSFSYRVIRGSIRRPRAVGRGSIVGTAKDFFVQGDLLPDGIFPETDIKSWLAEGRIENAMVSVDAARAAAEEIRARGKFRSDPASLVGKSLEQLRLIVLEIDADYDVSSLADQRDAVRLLTSDWDPRYADRIAPVSDRSRPEALVAHDLKQGEHGEAATSSSPGREMSEKALAALASAREAAKAPESAEQPAEQPVEQPAQQPAATEPKSALEIARAKATQVAE